MRVKMKTLAAGPEFVLQAGQEVDLAPKVAQALVDGGYAEVVVPSQVERATAEPKEKATAPPQAKKARSRAKARPKAEPEG